jgi:hypothetical protein
MAQAIDSVLAECWMVPGLRFIRALVDLYPLDTARGGLPAGPLQRVRRTILAVRRVIVYRCASFFYMGCVLSVLVTIITLIFNYTGA